MSKIKGNTPERTQELKDLHRAKVVAELPSKLEKIAQAYQDGHMSVNESKALLGASLAGTQLGEKAMENLAWLKAVWQVLYYDAIDNNDSNPSADSIPVKEWKFTDLQEEAGL